MGLALYCLQSFVFNGFILFLIVLIELTSNEIDTTFHGLFHQVIFHLLVLQNSSKNVFMLVTKDFPLEKPYKERPLALFLDPLLCT